MITKEQGNRKLPFDKERFEKFFEEIVEDTKDKEKFSKETLKNIKDSVVEFVSSQEEVEAERLIDYIIRDSNEQISVRTPFFTHLSASALRRKLYKQASRIRGFDYHKGYGDYYTLVKKLVESGKYHPDLIEDYTEEELKEIGELIDPSKDKLFDYSGLHLLTVTYLVQDQSGDKKEIIELPQERFMTSIIYLMKEEDKDKRMQYIKDAYHAISNHYVGLATPTLKNSGLPKGSLSSCHIISVGDDLQSIFNANTQAARFSQNGSGLGIYLGELRASGSWIRGVKGNATGVIHPARLNSVIAEYVNQGGKKVCHL